MSTGNRLRAVVKNSHYELIGKVADEREMADRDAERAIFKEGLAAMGYIERPTDDAELWLYYTRFVGQALGLSGLAALALGVFWGQLAGIYGFGLLVLGFLIIVVSDAIRIYGGGSEVGEL